MNLVGILGSWNFHVLALLFSGLSGVYCEVSFIRVVTLIRWA